MYMYMCVHLHSSNTEHKNHHIMTTVTFLSIFRSNAGQSHQFSHHVYRWRCSHVSRHDSPSIAHSSAEVHKFRQRQEEGAEEIRQMKQERLKSMMNAEAEKKFVSRDITVWWRHHVITEYCVWVRVVAELVGSGYTWLCICRIWKCWRVTTHGESQVPVLQWLVRV